MATPDNEKHDGNNNDGDRDGHGNDDVDDYYGDDDGGCDGDDGNDDDNDEFASAVQLQDLYKKELCGGEDPVEI